MLDEKLISDLKAKYGDNLAAVQARDGSTFVFRKPGRLEFDRWFDKRDTDGSKAARELVQATLVYPDAQALLTALDNQAALLMCKNGFFDTVAGMAGMDGEGAVSKKL